MADFTLVIPDGKEDMLIDAIARQKGWEEEPDPSDPAWDPLKTYYTKPQFAKRWGYSMLRAVVRQDLKQTAQETSQAAIDAEMALW